MTDPGRADAQGAKNSPGRDVNLALKIDYVSLLAEARGSSGKDVVRIFAEELAYAWRATYLE